MKMKPHKLYTYHRQPNTTYLFLHRRCSDFGVREGTIAPFFMLILKTAFVGPFGGRGLQLPVESLNIETVRALVRPPSRFRICRFPNSHPRCFGIRRVIMNIKQISSLALIAVATLATIPAYAQNDA